MNTTAINTISKTSGIVTANGIITDINLNEEALGMTTDEDTVNSGVTIVLEAAWDVDMIYEEVAPLPVVNMKS